MDANAKLGSDIIKGSPHKISSNGKLLNDLIDTRDLVVVNSLDICSAGVP